LLGVSFRSQSQIEAHAGCGAVKIAPALMPQLSQEVAKLEQNLWPHVTGPHPERLKVDEAIFRLQLNEDAMAEKLSEGIRIFIKISDLFGNS
jgi:transaldolase